MEFQLCSECYISCNYTTIFMNCQVKMLNSIALVLELVKLKGITDTILTS